MRASFTNGGSTTYFLNDGSMPVLELNGSGTVTALNLFGADGIVARENSTGAWSEYAFDFLGNTALRTAGPNNPAGAPGAAIGSYAYDAYGWFTAAAGSAAADPWMYQAQSGYYFDSATDSNLCGHRFYDPNLGRWLNRDPIGFAGGSNLYGYCAGNPVLHSDPLGLEEAENGEGAGGIGGDGPIGFGMTGGADWGGEWDPYASGGTRPPMSYFEPPVEEVEISTAPASPEALSAFGSVDCEHIGSTPNWPSHYGFDPEKPLFDPAANNGEGGGRNLLLVPSGPNVNNFQRIGDMGGYYAAMLGTPPELISLPAGSLGLVPQPFGLRGCAEAQVGYASPFFGQPGRGIQVMFTNPISTNPIVLAGR